MPFDTPFRLAMPLTIGVLSLAFIALGLYALIRRRPFVFHARWMLALIILAMAPSIFMQLSIYFSGGRSLSSGLRAMLLITALSLVIVICFLALQMRGYIVLGTTQDSFREALMAAIANLNLKSEETMSSIRLPSVSAEIQVAIQGWIGTGQLRLRRGGRPGLLADIAGAMNAYFSSANVKTNMTSPVVYLILGVLMGAVAILMIVFLPLRAAHPPSQSRAGQLLSGISLRVESGLQAKRATSN